MLDTGDEFANVTTADSGGFTATEDGEKPNAAPDRFGSITDVSIF
ncbi:hypothetical protein RSSM_01942 [Rhodopirellula sallentina SM41]|uniref:Uncharacterized protein n=1 Tax=Rhodopirellula sallentina SM41 TaxID=1263870 RepID=M5U5Q5_9BACT|nr:hypothetical protein RSSM_01942 [Rhodopirellula sallentina SM41]